MIERMERKPRAKYVDGFVMSVPKKNLAQYKKMAREARDVWIRLGALEYKECIMNDVEPKFITFTFPKMAKTKPDETVWFSFITFKSRKHRDAVNQEVMKYFDEKYGKNNMPVPVDMKRFAYGGFKVEVSD